MSGPRGSESGGAPAAMRKVAEFADLPEGRGKRVEIGGEKVLLVRDGGAVRAYSAECPHAGAPLDEGAVCGGRIVCPWHKGAFRVSDGALLEPPALGALPRYPVRVDGGGAVLVSPERMPPDAPPPAADARTMLIGSGKRRCCPSACAALPADEALRLVRSA